MNVIWSLRLIMLKRTKFVLVALKSVFTVIFFFFFSAQTALQIIHVCFQIDLKNKGILIKQTPDSPLVASKCVLVQRQTITVNQGRETRNLNIHR